MANEKVHTITDADVPTMDNDTRHKIKKGATIALGAVAVLLLVDDQVKKFKRRKDVKITVVESDSSSTP